MIDAYGRPLHPAGGDHAAQRLCQPRLVILDPEAPQPMPLAR